MSTGTTIRQIRERLGWSQKELAKKSGINLNTIICYENDRSNPSTKKFEQILNAMGYDLYAKPRKKEGV